MNSIIDGYGSFAIGGIIFVLVGPMWSVFSSGLVIILVLVFVMMGFLSAYLAMGMIEYVQQYGTAFFVAVIMSSMGALEALIGGFILYFFLEFRFKPEERLPERERAIVKKVK